MRRVFLPLLLFLFFTIESIFVQLLPSEYFMDKYILVPRFLIGILMLFAIYGKQKQAVIYGFVFGLLFDIVYTEIIGVYLFLFPLTIVMVSRLMRVFHANVLVAIVAILAAISALEIVIYKLNNFIGITEMPFSAFAEVRLLPVIVLNFVFLAVAFYPFRRFFEKLAQDESL
ncbi:rod shape-determining protein MreD [Bacillus sp. FJAT-18017]|uniref:rod shape-determining protein MreD n=1 Tax=Bacillus sp. FJAT-18017 TaxID=1705566 RepID=UPI0006AF91B5|nr:rod shape-determining protein MreD [Bacillus sp. FJAT-18017]ALC89799.1 rod shape-determining protein MreD [Bacillus sp. FJAT-18017]